MAKHFRADDAGPSWEPPEPSPLVEEILAALENAGAPQELCDRIVKDIEQWEFTLSEPNDCGPIEVPDEPEIPY